jgi:two-component system, sensor histidine kinase and response regulator
MLALIGAACRRCGVRLHRGLKRLAPPAATLPGERPGSWLTAALDGIVTLDAAGLVLDLNPSAEHLLDTPAAVLCGQPLGRCLSLERLSAEARALLLDPPEDPATPQRRELELVTAGGRCLPIEVTVITWCAPQGRVRTLVIRDLTERCREQALLEERVQRANLANEAKGRFLAAMSHEIRTPLNAILNMNELLLETDLDEEQRNYAVTAGESARALLSIVNSVLDFSKIEGCRVAPAPRSSDPETIVQSAVDLLAARARAQGLELTVLCDPGVPERIDTDPGLVRQILLNLLGNAIRFTDEGAVRIRIERDRAAGALCFAVRDTGVGIAAAEQAELFSEFKQAHGPGGRPQGGSGLGLAISRRLARLLGGDVTLVSAPGEGSCFTLALPLPDGVPDGARAARAAVLADWQVSLWAESALLADDLAAQLGAFGLAVSIVTPPRTDRPVGCCGELRLRRRTAAAPRGLPRDIRLYRVGGRCADVPPADRPAARLRLPVTPSALLQALCDAVSGAPPTDAAPPVDDLAERVARVADTALPVLLAEDSRANQLVATTILGKAGFRVDVVENGLQAVAAVNRGNYSLVLMDMAMPDMDGIEATGCIRALPGKRGRVPIVAMTANAFDEDRRRCLEAGMDDYLSKPMERRALYAALLRWIGSEAGAGGAVAGAPPSASPAAAAPAPLGEHALLQDDASAPELDERVIGALAADLPTDLMPEIVATFVVEVDVRVAAIEQAALAGDADLARAQGHALKGSAATFGAAALRDLAHAIEQAGRFGDVAAVRAHTFRLRRCAERTLSRLQQRFPGPSAPGADVADAPAPRSAL